MICLKIYQWQHWDIYVCVCVWVKCFEIYAIFYKQNRLRKKNYFAFIQPIFEYGSAVWVKSPRHDLLNEMEKKQ